MILRCLPSCKHTFSPPFYPATVDKDEKDLTEGLKELSKRISTLEQMLSVLTKPFTDVLLPLVLRPSLPVRGQRQHPSTGQTRLLWHQAFIINFISS